MMQTLTLVLVLALSLALTLYDLLCVVEDYEDTEGHVQAGSYPRPNFNPEAVFCDHFSVFCCSNQEACEKKSPAIMKMH